MRCMNSKRLALLTALTALCVGIQLAPRPPNIEFTSLICFLSGFLFGAVLGASLGAMTMFINGFLSPWGVAGPIMYFQITGMALVGAAGGIYRKFLDKNSLKRATITFEVAILAAFLTLIYDVITNVGHAFLFNINIIVALVTGVWLMIVHVASNVVLFGAAFFDLVKTVSKLLGESVWEPRKGH